MRVVQVYPLQQSLTPHTPAHCHRAEHSRSRAGGAHCRDDGQRERQGPGRVPGRRHGRVPVQARAQGPSGRGAGLVLMVVGYTWFLPLLARAILAFLSGHHSAILQCKGLQMFAAAAAL